METHEEVVQHNVRELRDQSGHTVRSLSTLLGKLGRPILPSGITKVEAGERRVDTGDLVALSIALNVNPNRILLPVDEPKREFPLTAGVSARQDSAWSWARGNHALLAGAVKTYVGDTAVSLVQDRFRWQALPPWERERDDHTAVRAAVDVIDSIRRVLDHVDNPERYSGPLSKWAQQMDRDNEQTLGPPSYTPRGLHARLKRLVAEVEALVGVDDGER